MRRLSGERKRNTFKQATSTIMTPTLLVSLPIVVQSHLSLTYSTERYLLGMYKSKSWRRATPQAQEIRALYEGVKRSWTVLRSFLASIGRPLAEPVIIYEDNDAAIKAVLADHLTPRLRHLDTLVTTLNEWYRIKHYVPRRLSSYQIHARGLQLQTTSRRTSTNTSTPCAWSTRFYPPPNSEHYKLNRKWTRTTRRLYMLISYIRWVE